MPSPISPEGIQGSLLQPDEVEAAAASMRLLGSGVADQGAVLLGGWQGIAAHYEAPEAMTLFTVMNPVKTSAESFGSNMAAVALALENFAEEARPIKAELARIAAEASTFRADISGGVEKTTYSRAGAMTSTVAWHEDQASVDANNTLIDRVEAQQVLLWAAERACANSIYDLIGQPSIHAASSSNPGGYGLNSIPDGAAMPWGAAVTRTESCGEQTAGAVGRFVWDGVIIGGVVGTVQGLGVLTLGYNPATGQFWQGEMYAQAWSGLGMLGVGLVATGPAGAGLSLIPGPVGDFFRGGQQALGRAGQGIVAWDKWAEDPATAAGTAFFNIATIVILAGAAVGAVTTGAGAGAAAIRTTALVMDVVDPAAWAIKGGLAAGKVPLPAIGDLLRTIDFTPTDFNSLSTLTDLGARADLPQLEVPHVEVPRLETPNVDLPNVSAGMGSDLPATAGAVADAPPVRALDDTANATIHSVTETPTHESAHIGSGAGRVDPTSIDRAGSAGSPDTPPSGVLDDTDISGNDATIGDDRPRDGGSQGDSSGSDGSRTVADSIDNIPPDRVLTTSDLPYSDPTHRPTMRVGVVDAVWENAKGPDGVVRDPNTGDEIRWTQGTSRSNVWDMGHVPGEKYSDVHSRYMSGELTPAEFRDWYNDPLHYRPELPSGNRSHRFE